MIFLYIPLFINLYAFYHLLNRHQLVDLYLEIFILFMALELVLFLLRQFAANSFAFIFV